jgi:hypothetical protein
VLDRQKKFEGDLNLMQTIMLQWLMAEESKEEIEAKYLDWEMNALAANQATNRPLIDQLQKRHLSEERDDGFLSPQEEAAIDWITPESPEEVEEMLDFFGEITNSDQRK